MTTSPAHERQFLWWLPGDLWQRACKKSDTLLTVALIDPFVRLWFPLVLRTGISPNAVTLARLGVAATAAACTAAGAVRTGAVLFVLWYVLDCVDGKVARVTGRLSKFGDWLDRMTDRLGIAAMFWGLATGCARAGANTDAAMCVAVVTVMFLRLMNGDRLEWLASELKSARTVGLEEAAKLRQSTSVRRAYLDWAAARRLTPWIIHDVEWLFLALVIGPVCGHIALCCGVASLGIVAQLLVRVISFWSKRIDHVASAPIQPPVPSAATLPRPVGAAPTG